VRLVRHLLAWTWYSVMLLFPWSYCSEPHRHRGYFPRAHGWPYQTPLVFSFLLYKQGWGYAFAPFLVILPQLRLTPNSCPPAPEEIDLQYPLSPSGFFDIKLTSSFLPGLFYRDIYGWPLLSFSSPSPRHYLSFCIIRRLIHLPLNFTLCQDKSCLHLCFCPPHLLLLAFFSNDFPSSPPTLFVAPICHRKIFFLASFLVPSCWTLFPDSLVPLSHYTRFLFSVKKTPYFFTPRPLRHHLAHDSCQLSG